MQASDAMPGRPVLVADLPAVLAVGFGTAVAMWAAGYAGRFPGVELGGPAMLVLLLACLVGGGFAAGRYANGPARAAAGAGAVAGLLNLLVLGSLLGEDAGGVPTAWLWAPGSVAISAAVAAAGGWLGSRLRSAGEAHWPGAFARVAVAATFLLLGVGGLVTSKEAGLAVVDWPNTYGYNMFLYPLSRMTGGIYYEHAHRLFGALVGLTTLVLALFLHRMDRRPWVRRLGWFAVVLVVIQGILGGLRVTGRFTLSTAAEDTAPSLALAVVHGVLAQAFFGLVVGLAAFTSRTWREGPARRPARHAAADHALTTLLAGLLVVQLVLGAMQRHTSSLLAVHITLAAIVAPVAYQVGARARSLNPDLPPLVRLGTGLMVLTTVQLLLGLGALPAVSGPEAGIIEPGLDVALATAHQWCGAALLGTAVLTLCWTRRFLARA